MRIAITGGIAEGKSTVLRIIAEHGFRTASADEVAREVFREGETNARLAALVGVQPPISGGELGAAIAARSELRRRVNGIMHPLVVAKLNERNADFDEIPLLIEACRQGDYDAVWVVSCAPETKEARLRERYGEDRFSEIARWQLPSAVRSAFADVVISTDGAIAEVQDRVASALNVLQKSRN